MEVREVEAGAELLLHGRLDVRTVPAVRIALHRAVDAGTGDLVLDVAGLEVWDSAGLGVLVGAARRAARQNRRVLLREPSLRLRRLVRMARLQRVLAVLEPVTVVPSR